MENLFRKLTILLAAALGLVLIGLYAAPRTARATAQATAHTAVSHATKSHGAAPAIKVSRAQVNKGVVPGKAHSKSSRGAGDYIHVDNHTDYAIDVYVDGDYHGTVDGYGDLYLHDNTGGTYTVYAVASGTDYSWGPHEVTSPFTWSLYE